MKKIEMVGFAIGFGFTLQNYFKSSTCDQWEINVLVVIVIV